MENREIKFRVFVAKDDNTMYYEGWRGSKFITKADIFAQGEDGVVMQYTGLLDNNGANIYEGDILDVPEFYETPEMTSTNYIKWVVVFKHGAFYLENKQSVADNDSSTLFNEYEGYDGRFFIIGNIYQNPELITKSNGENG